MSEEGQALLMMLHLGGLDRALMLAAITVLVQEIKQLPAQAPVLADEAVDLPRVMRHVHAQHLLSEEVLKLLLHHLQSTRIQGMWK